MFQFGGLGALLGGLSLPLATGLLQCHSLSNY